MWEDLQKQYGVASVPNINQLKASIFECRQGGMSVVKFYSKVRGLWSKLDNHVHILQCTYARCIRKGCERNLVSRIVEMFEADKSYQFLLGLNDDFYSQVRS